VVEQITEERSSPTGEQGEPADAVTAEAGETPRPPRGPIVLLNDIRALAYQKWQAAGCPSADCAHFWLEAERELMQAP
jgi:hypothetical protein